MKKVYFFIFITMTLTLFSCNANYAIFKKVGRVWIIKQSIIKSKGRSIKASPFLI